jgi:NifU-like protein involved in Fe-S cluster formation
MLLESLVGKTTVEAMAFSPRDMRALLGVPLTTRRLQCAFLPLLTLRNALRKQRGEELLTWAELLEEDAG